LEMSTRAVLLFVLVAVACNAEVLYEWQQIDYEWPSNQHKTAALSSGDYAPEKIGIGGIKEWDETVYVLTPRTSTGGVPATISSVVVGEDGKPVLRPFPSWESQAERTVVCFELDRKGRMYTVERTESADHLHVYDIENKALIEKIKLPRRVESISVDDHSRSYTSIRDTDAATAFMLSTTPELGSDGKILVYRHRHDGRDPITEYPLPYNYDKAGAGSKASLGITVHNDNCFLSSPRQLFSFRADEAKAGDRNVQVYPVAKGEATAELQAVFYHPVAKAVIYGRDSMVYKLSPMSAWSETYEAGQVALSEPGDLLDNISGLAADWKYDLLVSSSRSTHDSTQPNHRISVVPSLRIFQQEQAAIREQMDFSDL